MNAPVPERRGWRRNWRGPIAAAIALVPAVTGAANYTAAPRQLDAGGGRSTSASYMLVSAVDGVAGVDAGSASYSARQGYLRAAHGLGQVVGEHLFYNGSAFDGGDPGADARDDAAIATDKLALLPGRTAGFTNYTSYSRGINGVMVDFEGLTGTPTAADFGFRVGNSDNHATWAAGPAAAALTVRPGGGAGGSTRVTLTWPDHAIERKWLRVEVFPTDLTDLDQPFLFFFGNAVGEAGNHPGIDTLVNATDEILARANPRDAANPAPVDFPYDFNRDGLVNGADQVVVRLNNVSWFSALRLITPSIPSASLAESGRDAGAGARLASASRATPRSVAEATEDAALTPAPSSEVAAGEPADGEEPARSGPRLVLLQAADGLLWVALEGGLLEGCRLEVWPGAGSAGWSPLQESSRSVAGDRWTAWTIDPAGLSSGTLFRVAGTPESGSR